MVIVEVAVVAAAEVAATTRSTRKKERSGLRHFANFSTETSFPSHKRPIRQLIYKKTINEMKTKNETNKNP